jgi:hypothetical protein
MEVENDIIEMDVETTSFPLLMLPADIQDFIASFLSFNDNELEEQFIERTKNKKKAIPEQCFNHVPSFTFGAGLKTLSAYCPNNKTIALFTKLYNQGKSIQTLIIIDRHNNQEICNIQLNQNNISTIAISRNKDMFATIHSVRDSSRGTFSERIYYKSILSIKNINSQKAESHEIPDYFSISHHKEYPIIAFNKQETHLILHGNDLNKLCDNSSDTIQHHIIFPVTVNTPNQNAEKRTLETYFRQQGICKNFTNQITS